MAERHMCAAAITRLRSFPISMQHVSQPDRLERRLQRRIEAGIDPGRTVAVFPVPAIDLAQGGGELPVGVAAGAGDIALGEVEDRALAGRGPYAEPLSILGSFDLRPSPGAGAKVEVLAIAVTGLKTADDLHARPSRGTITSTARSR
jgi:hypothetical protein